MKTLLFYVIVRTFLVPSPLEGASNWWRAVVNTVYIGKCIDFKAIFVGMPGANCSIYGCHTCRSKKYKGIAIFKVPAAKDDFNTTWRGRLIHAITKDRVIDESLRKQINECNLYICEKHYTSDQIIQRKYLIFILLCYSCHFSELPPVLHSLLHAPYVSACFG